MNQPRKHPLAFWQKLSTAKLTRIACVLTVLLVFLGLSPISQARATQALKRKTNPIQHIVIMVKENRTFDNYFGTFPGADGATTYTGTDGKQHPLTHDPDTLVSDILHTHYAYLKAFDHGKLDKFSQLKGAIQDINGQMEDVADGQMYQSDIPNYWQYAQTFALPDHFFYTINSDSFPNHLFSIAATDDDVFGLPHITKQKDKWNWGCDAPPNTYVQQEHPDGTFAKTFPCFSFETLGDLLTANGISWKYYAPGQGQDGYEWSAYNAISDIRNTQQWQQHVVDYTQFAKDAAAGTLPTVSWLVQPSSVSDHPPASVCVGENFTVQQINAIMNNQSLWSSTAIFLTWDDWGAFYDHVVPPTGPNKYLEYGLRAPLIVISPYVKPGFIDHTFYSFPSMLKYVETTLNLPSLGGLDQQANDLTNVFNYSQQPLPPLVLQTRSCSSQAYKVSEQFVPDPDVYGD
ncbi:MAG TPA: alkaline phosphatase family protein [Ktedonobacteraceae bacterium]|jgi:phospholipase C|nr:alkaline phosphatase family protein [Ktedonobacteraceae bacterium]